MPTPSGLSVRLFEVDSESARAAALPVPPRAGPLQSESRRLQRALAWKQALGHAAWGIDSRTVTRPPRSRSCQCSGSDSGSGVFSERWYSAVPYVCTSHKTPRPDAPARGPAGGFKSRWARWLHRDSQCAAVHRACVGLHMYVSQTPTRAGRGGGAIAKVGFCRMPASYLPVAGSRPPEVAL